MDLHARAWWQLAALRYPADLNAAGDYRYELFEPVGRNFDPKFKADLAPAEMRGWFQSYCRYYMGRRMLDEDRRQIKRWKAIRRHVHQLQLACEPGDL